MTVIMWSLLLLPLTTDSFNVGSGQLTAGTKKRGLVWLTATGSLPRRAFVAGSFSAGLGLTAPSAANAVLDARGNQLAGLSDRTGPLDVTPFSVVVDKVRDALEAVGVEGAPPPPPLELRGYAGPPIKRDYEIGRRPGSDRLRKCPGTESAACASSAEEDGSPAFVAPFVYFDQKGDALGGLQAYLFDTPRWNLLGTDGNFFNGQGVFLLAEYEARDGSTYDCEFNFLPNVLESVVDVRAIRRSGKGDDSAPATVLAALAEAMAWVPLKTGRGGGGLLSLDNSFASRSSAEAREAARRARELRGRAGLRAAEGSEDEEVYQAAAVEWRIRAGFEKELEEADVAIVAQMEEEERRVEKLKQDITKLLDQLERQDDQRERESRALRRRVVDARETYYEGVLKRQGSYRNSGAYGSVISRQSTGASIGTSINKDEGITTKVLNRNKLD